MAEVGSKLKIKTPEKCQWSRSVVVIVNFEGIPQVLLFSLLTFNKWMVTWWLSSHDQDGTERKGGLYTSIFVSTEFDLLEYLLKKIL